MRTAILPAVLLLFLNTSPTADGQEPSGRTVAVFNDDAPLAKITKSPGVRHVTPGPWGDLHYTTRVLEPSAEYLSLCSDLHTWRDGTIWGFDEKDATEITTLLKECGLSDEQISRVVEPGKLARNEKSGLLEFKPSDALILELTPNQRRRLYSNLEPDNQINAFRQPFSLPVGGIRSTAFVEMRVPEAQIARIEQLTYSIEGALRFSDTPFIFSKAKNDEERYRLLKILSRETSFSVKLTLSDQSNLDELANYWGAGGRNSIVRPILESFLCTSGSEELSLVHLLPSTPRRLLHSYPATDGESSGDDLPDCFWTAYGFFGDSPPDRHLDYIRHVFEERYVPATEPLQFGDLIMFTDGDVDGGIHACNYLAGDLVFTKNGRSLGRPWVISNLATVKEAYRTVENLKVTFHRLKPEYRR